MSVDKDTVRRIARLARLAVPESRLEPMAGELNGIFQWVEMLGEANAIKCADNYRALRKRGITIRKTIDSFIATYCIENKYPLLFQDRDFLPFVEHLGLLPVIKSA